MHDLRPPTGATPERLARLLEIALCSTREELGVGDEVKHELLLTRLRELSAPSPTQWQRLETLLDEVCQELRPQGQPTLEALLTGPSTSLEDLERVKSVTKREAGSMGEGPAKHVSVVLYYASIAAAMMGHHVRISSLEPDRLRQRFLEFSQLGWLTPRLRQLFSSAATATTHDIPA